MKLSWLVIFLFLSTAVAAQGFEVTIPQDNMRGKIGETMKVPIRFKNVTDKSIILVVKKLNGQIGSTQKNFFCIDNNCLDSKIDDFILKIEPGQTLNTMQIALEAGLVSGETLVKYAAYNRSNPSELVEFDLNFVIDEKVEKESIYTSRDIILHDVYPNPARGDAFVNYKILKERIKARMVIHNILGNVVNEYILSVQDNKFKIRTEELSAGIYFYTLYIDGEGVLTRKLIVNN